MIIEGFKPVTLESIASIAPFLKERKSLFGELTVGEKFIWRNVYKDCYRIYQDTLLMYEEYETDKICFFFPIGPHIEEGLNLIGRLCLENHLHPEFCCLTPQEDRYMKEHYRHSSSYTVPDWADYVYDVLPLQTFAGKHLSGKRYYLNKFKNAHPDYVFHIGHKEDLPFILKGYKELYDATDFDTEDKKVEYDEAGVMIEHFPELGLLCGYITVEGKMVALSLGEIIGDVLFVHIEKALLSYEGSYQAMVNEFAKAFGTGLKYINREDDNGDIGLRNSKLQYHPALMAPKIFLGIENKIDLIEKLPVIQLMDSLSLGPVLEKDKAAYFQMSVDEELNRYWGYDYKEDFPEKEPDEDDIFLSFQKDFESKNEVSFGLHFKDRLIGEVVFNKIKMNNTSEVGIRIIKAYQGLGYAKKALSAACQYAFEELDYPYISACCFKENIPSQKSLISSGFIKAGEDEKMLRFVKIRK